MIAQLSALRPVKADRGGIFEALPPGPHEVLSQLVELHPGERIIIAVPPKNDVSKPAGLPGKGIPACVFDRLDFALHLCACL